MYYSLTDPSHRVSFREAVVHGLAPDGGLYMPETIPVLPDRFIAALPDLSKAEIAFTVARPFVDDSFSDTALKQLVEETLDFDFPLTDIGQNCYALELFHGPTLAFKDVGARFMARILKHIARNSQQEITILVATSGDTGSAVAHGFYEVEGIRVIILYPEGKVSQLQEKQLATLGKNIHAVKIDGTFDDCQRLVKQAFQDDDLRRKLFLTSANSINIARLIPQSLYYFIAWSKLQHRNKVVFSVPSGNFGNLTAGVLAKKMGLPVHAFIASTNSNDVVPEYLNTKQFIPRPSVQTISNAMDVGNPSNFPRLLALYNQDWLSMTTDIKGYAFTDDETRHIIQKVYSETDYILDPHGAVGYLGLTAYKKANADITGIFLETAHPSKFPEVVSAAIREELILHPSLLALRDKTVMHVSCSSDYDELKQLLFTTG
jgi:threonine synthase